MSTFVIAAALFTVQICGPILGLVFSSICSGLYVNLGRKFLSAMGVHFHIVRNIVRLSYSRRWGVETREYSWEKSINVLTLSCSFRNMLFIYDLSFLHAWGEKEKWWKLRKEGNEFSSRKWGRWGIPLPLLESNQARISVLMPLQ